MHPEVVKLFDLSGKVAMVTGGAVNLGFDAASVLAGAGCHLVITSRDVQRAGRSAETLRTLTQPVWRLLLPLAILALYAIVAARWIVTFPIDSTRPTRWAERGFLIFLTVAAPLIQLVLAAAVWHMPLFEFFADTTSPSVTGFYSVAVTTPDLPARLSPGQARR